MALIDTYDDDDENEITTQGSQPIQPGQGGTVQQGTTPKKGTGWTNLESYISANEARSQKMGEDVVKSIDQNIGSAQSKLGEQVKQTADTAVKDTGVIQNLAKDPSAIKTEDFEKQYNAQWNAPSSAQEFDDFYDVQGRVDKTSEAAKQADDFSGRKELLKTAYNQPKYSAGEQRLDSFILGGTNKGQENIQAIREKAGQAKAGWEEILGNFNKQLGDAKDLTNRTAAETRAAYDTSVADWDKSIQAKQLEADNLAKKNEASYLKLLSNLSSGNVDAYKQAGIDQNVGSYLDSLGYNVGGALQRGDNKSLGDLVSPEMKEDYSALLGLRGLDSSYNLDPTGASGAAYRTNADILGRAGDVYNLGTSLDSRVADMTKQQKTDYDTINRAFDSKVPLQERLGLASVVASRLGASEAEVQEAMQLGLDPSRFVKQGKGLNRANVASAEEAAQWNDLMSYLGLSNLGDKGSLYNTDGDAFKNALSAARLAQTNIDPLNKTTSIEKAVRLPGDTVMNTAPKVVDTIATPAKKLADNTIQQPMKEVGKAATTVRKPVDKVVNAAPKVVDKAASPVKKAVDNVVAKPIQKGAKSTKATVNRAGRGTAATARRGGGAVKSTSDKVVSGAKSTGGKISSEAKKIGKKLGF
jgi:hypothetical protein